MFMHQYTYALTYHTPLYTSPTTPRYSGTIERLTYITNWWKQLSDVEQASVANLHRMILSCEGELEREREAWLSTSMATKLLAEAGGPEAEKKGGEGDHNEGNEGTGGAAGKWRQ
jgi:hypothetical protein